MKPSRFTGAGAGSRRPGYGRPMCAASTGSAAQRPSLTGKLADRPRSSAHLRVAYEVSERRACSALGADRTSIRYRNSRPDDTVVRARLRELAAIRRRFGYRRLHILLTREGIVMNHKKLRRLYREERLQVRRRGGRKRALGTIRAAGRARTRRADCLARPSDDVRLRQRRRADWHGDFALVTRDAGGMALLPGLAESAAEFSPRPPGNAASWGPRRSTSPAARLRHIAGTAWSTKRYLNIGPADERCHHYVTSAGRRSAQSK